MRKIYTPTPGNKPIQRHQHAQATKMSQLGFDLPAARILATYRVPERAPLDDALIAAVAQSREMTIATRNTKHFEALGAPSYNPWEGVT